MSQPAYPALYDVTGKKLYSLLGTVSFVVGRSETADLTVLDVNCSRKQFRIVQIDGQYFAEQQSSVAPTFHNNSPIGARVALAHEDRLSAGNSQFIFLTRHPSGTGSKADVLAMPTAAGKAVARATPPPPRPPQPMMTVMAKAGDVPLPPPPEDELRPIRLSGRMLIGREQDRVQIPLLHPQISRVHAHITLEADRAVIVDLNSANGTFVNGKRIRKATTVRRDDQIDIGPYALTFDGSSLLPRSRADNVELVARGVTRIVTNRETGKPLTLLDGINLVIRPQEFVCLLGPSGSGKSTLLSALSGRTVPDRGCVLVNGQDLHANFDALKQDIAVVPQKDILHDSLSVGDALWYTARLRLPPDLGRDEVHDCIHQTLDTVSLTQRRGTLIRYLSGGQVKRASLANEIMCKPSLLFLDEVTSGLDEQTDREMMDLFRSVADTGKTVVCITHSLANVERTCHLVVILTAGGKLAFVGKPIEALDYFQIQRLGDVYERLKQHPIEHWQQKFKADELYNRYVASRLPRQEEEPPPPIGAGSQSGGQLTLFLRQTVLLTQRYFAIWRGDYLSLLAMLGQSILVAILLGLLFGDLETVKKDGEKAKNAKLEEPQPPRGMPPSEKDKKDYKDRQEKFIKDKIKNRIEESKYPTRALNLLFLLAVTSFWFGCNNAAKEIVKERIIYSRERDFNVQVLSYYTSKFLLLVLFTGIQTIVLTIIVHFWCGPPGHFAGQCAFLMGLSLAGVTLGLAISAAAPTEEMAITLIPMAIIPQIILANLIAPVEKVSELLAQGLITVYWGNRGLDALLSQDIADAAMPKLVRGTWPLSLSIVFLHTFVFILAALVILFWQGFRARGLTTLIRRVAGAGSRH